MPQYIKKEDLIPGRWYFCDARSFTYGMWTGSAFLHLNYKWGRWLLSLEYHWDDEDVRCGTLRGTVKPYMEK